MTGRLGMTGACGFIGRRLIVGVAAGEPAARTFGSGPPAGARCQDRPLADPAWRREHRRTATGCATPARRSPPRGHPAAAAALPSRPCPRAV